MATFVFCLTASLFSLALGETVQSSPAETDFEGNHYGSCVCQQNCPSKDVLLEFQQLEERVQSLSQSQTEQNQVLEMKIESLRESILQEVQALQETAQGLGQTLSVLQGHLICPADFRFDCKSRLCIKHYTSNVSWTEANDYCRVKGPGYRLAVLETNDAFLFIQTLLTESNIEAGTQVWLGGHQEDDEGRWLWSTGKEITHGWGDGEPNDERGQEDCFSMAKGVDWPTWMFNDMVCPSGQDYICEYHFN